MSIVTSRELSHQTAEILRRVEAGETISVTRNGELIATLAPASDWRKRRQELVDKGIISGPGLTTGEMLAKHVPLPLPEGMRSPLEALLEMREEEDR